jgi:hypothetical protein
MSHVITAFEKRELQLHFIGKVVAHPFFVWLSCNWCSMFVFKQFAQA